MKISTIIISLFATSVAALAQDRAETSAYPGEWSQWRGPERSGHINQVDWPARLNSKNLTKLWRVPMGPSYSGPVVSSDLVFTTSTEDKKSEVVTAISRKTGEVVWRVEWDGAMKVPFFANRNGSESCELHLHMD